MKRLSKTLIALIIVICAFAAISGCSSEDKFKDFEDGFEQIYFDVIKDVDLQHTYDSLKNLQSEKNLGYINEMGNLIKNIKSDVPKSKQKRFKEICDWYDGLVFLKDIYKKWGSLSGSDKGRITSEMLGIGMVKKDKKYF